MKNILKYELKFLASARLIYILLPSFCLLIFYSVTTRSNWLAVYHSKVDSLNKKETAEITGFKRKLDSVITYQVKEKALRQSPKNPYSLVLSLPVHAVFPLDERAVIASGQSDIFANFFINNDDWQNPLLLMETPVTPFQQLFGVVDLAYILIYILPIIIIAFSFNLISSEKELGTLKMLMSSSVSPFTIFSIKIGLRLAIVFATTVLAILLSFLYNDITLVSHWQSFLYFFGILFLYISFWFLLSFYINLKGKTTGTNAVALMSCWLCFLVIIPVVANLITTALIPPPSRSAYTAAHWKATGEDEKKERNETLDKFYQDHPELVLAQDTLNSDKEWLKLFDFYRWVIAAIESINKKTAPALIAYNEALQKRATLANGLRFLSPSIILQQELDNIAGTSHHAYQQFYKGSEKNRKTFSGFIRKKIFNGEFLTSDEPDKVKVVKYTDKPAAHVSWLNFSCILLYVGILVLLIKQNNSFRYE